MYHADPTVMNYNNKQQTTIKVVTCKVQCISKPVLKLYINSNTQTHTGTHSVITITHRLTVYILTRRHIQTYTE